TRSLRANLAINGSLILIWYVFSTSLSLYNKWLFGNDHLNFSFPLLTSAIHMAIQFLLTGAILMCLPKQRPQQTPSPFNYFTKILPCAVATGLDVGLSNLSLQTITLSFYTMCKSSSLAFVLLFAFLFRLEQPRLTLIGIIAIISVGVFLMAMSEVEFVLVGFVEVMMAAAMSGLRWSLTQILLQDETIGISSPLASMFFLSPLMALCLLVASACVEPLGSVLDKVLATSGLLASEFTIIIILGGVLATLMVLAEFQLISRTSVVTLSVAGIFKEVVTIIFATLTFKDKLTTINLLGLSVTLFGIGLYKWIKIRQMRQASKRDSLGYKVVHGQISEEPNRYSTDTVHRDNPIPLNTWTAPDQISHHSSPSRDVTLTRLSSMSSQRSGRFQQWVNKNSRSSRGINGFVPLADANIHSVPYSPHSTPAISLSSVAHTPSLSDPLTLFELFEDDQDETDSAYLKFPI
ncbi:hypothetical protein IWQ61_009902, partial [Dispira simplex]